MDFVKLEENILKLWEDGDFFNKLRAKNKDKKPFRFQDGPITANNPMGIHHAWGRSAKDIILRYKAMQGHSCHYRNGFDTQGLWVEVEVEKELGFKDKKDIEAYGMEKFTEKCIQRIQKFSDVITNQSKRLGQWMDWDNSYYTHSDENITAIWHFLKLCHEKGWIAQSHRPMPWCPRCGTSLSEHEMTGSYKELEHTAVFAIAKLPKAEYDILVWTTTPWTLAANVALAVNPELDYALVSCQGIEKPIVLAKNAIKHIEGDKQVIRLLKGEELLGQEYETFFPNLPAQQGFTHTIIPWDAVGADEGSGIVHIAPGCGAEDYELGKTFNLPAICPIDESGNFLPNYDFLTGISASQAPAPVFNQLQNQGKLFKTHNYSHSYPVCWRCKTEVLFRLVREWYIKTDELRPKLIQAANTVQWEPPFIGKRMLDWLNNMGDWNISRKRFYGLPLPFYPCDSCGHLTVIGSKEELGASLPHLHRPWIDTVKIPCQSCGNQTSRIPEVGDVWLDAGIVPFSTLGYFSNRKKWEQSFPAEWVIEMQEQVRLWFYSQLFMSVVITGKAPYKKVQTNNWVLAEDGTKFSKTGHMIRFDEAASRAGADAIRYLFASASTTSDVRFGYSLTEAVQRKLLGFWNIYTFFTTYADVDKPTIQKESHPSNLMDKWLQTRIARFVETATKAYENYNTADLIREFEHLVDDVSNWYIRANRRRFWKEGSDQDKQEAYTTLFYAIKTITQVMAPILPFLTEYIWQNLILTYANIEESVHLSDFPAIEAYDHQVLENAEKSRGIIAQGLKLRNEHSIKIKQPLQTLYLLSPPHYESIIKEELNIKEIKPLNDFGSLTTKQVNLNFQVAGAHLKGDINKVKALLEPADHSTLAETIKNNQPVNLPGYDSQIPASCFTILAKDKPNMAISESVAINTEVTPTLKQEGLFRELLRHCQLLRKEAGFAISDRVSLSLTTDSTQLKSVIQTYKDNIAKEALATITHTPGPTMTKDINLGEEQITISIQ
ncbi:MAG: isoleucine--tRNA ligase [Defluviitaleaceae bacterium]|nr:isoleucine--tRNA ligase [Defluviitaleaceae bacterium]